MIDTPSRIAFLKKIHLFHGLEESELAAVADQLVETPYTTGTVVYEQNKKADNFYLIYKGSVRITNRRKEKGKAKVQEKVIATLVANDYFGFLELIDHKPRAGTAAILTDAVLLSLSRENFEKLLKQSPQFLSNLDIVIESRRLANSLQFRWLAPDEVIYFLARKHLVVLIRSLILPFLALFLPGMLLYFWVGFAHSLVVLFASLLSLIFIILWAIWLVIDWGNDYYIVTNRRVVWLEKVVAVYDSRQESPLNTILAVAVETDLLGRSLDFGDVVIRTFVGKVIFSKVSHPRQAQRMIEEYWNRTKEQAVGMEKEAMKDALRKRLGLSVAQPQQAAPLKKADFPKEKGLGRILRYFGAERLRLRYEQGDSVIYRKHWIVLIQQAWIPILGLLLILGAFLYRLYQLAISPDSLISLQNGLTVDAWGGALIIAFFPLLGWLIYQIIDWSNDIYQVTNEQIIDLDKKPLGTQTRNVSQLESILGTESKRSGLLGEIFNVGNVYITVGGTKLVFENVIDPATVQSDIDRRRMAQQTRKRDKETAIERERMAEWLAAYHQNADVFRKEENDRKQKPE